MEDDRYLADRRQWENVKPRPSASFYRGVINGAFITFIFWIGLAALLWWAFTD